MGMNTNGTDGYRVSDLAWPCSCVGESAIKELSKQAKTWFGYKEIETCSKAKVFEGLCDNCGEHHETKKNQNNQSRTTDLQPRYKDIMIFSHCAKMEH